MLNNLFKNTARVLLLTAVMTSAAYAQTTAFTYQGSLAVGGTPANGPYDFEFRLFDSLAGGTQQGSTLQRLNVSLTNGSFNVSLDFGACPTCFIGANRFLEISVTPAGGGALTTLSPRQQIASSPYSIKSLNSATADGLSVACANCITSGQIGSVSGSALTGSIPVGSVPAGSASYIQNTTSPQALSHFNVSGTGTANTVNATNQYNIGGSRILGNAGTNNLFAGVNAGPAIITGNNNAFFGSSAGMLNTASSNSFFGSNAGLSNQPGASNSFFGRSAGQANETGNFNAFFGTLAGLNNTASDNSFFGASAGNSNETGTFNSFFGRNAGQSNRVGESNSFFGTNAGFSNLASSNSFFGTSAGQANTIGNFNSFFGTNAGFSNNTASNNSFFGWSAGHSNQSGTRNSFFGGGAGQTNQTGDNNSFFGAFAGEFNISGTNNTVIGALGNLGSDNLTNATAIGSSAYVTQSNSLVLGSIAGVNSATADTNVGIGTTIPNFPLSFANTVGDKISLWGQSGNHYGFGIQGGLLQIHSSGSSDDVAFGFGRSAAFTETMRVKGNGNVGIGTAAPKTRLHIAAGNVFIAQPGSLIITSPNGSCWQIRVNDTGTVFAASVACP